MSDRLFTVMLTVGLLTVFILAVTGAAVTDAVADKPTEQRQAVGTFAVAEGLMFNTQTGEVIRRRDSRGEWRNNYPSYFRQPPCYPAKPEIVNENDLRDAIKKANAQQGNQ